MTSGRRSSTFANKVPFYGAVVCCADDEHLSAVTGRMTRRVTTYGMSESADVTATDVVLGPMSVTATVKRRARRSEEPGKDLVTLGRLELNVPGHHNLLNALAAVAVGLEIGVPFERIAPGLREFRGRGAPLRGPRRTARHHGGGRLRPSPDGDRRGAGRRTRPEPTDRRGVPAAQVLADQGAVRRVRSVVAGADYVVLTDIYAAGEDPIPGVTLDALAASRAVADQDTGRGRSRIWRTWRRRLQGVAGPATS